MSKNKSVLIVEDEPSLQDAFRLVIESGGYEVYTAYNGLVGIEMIKSKKPNLVLLDIFMPVMDGRELLRNIDLEEYPNTTVIVYSNLSDQQTETEMLELGAHEFILKSSMTPRDLLDLVKKNLN